jgi:multiple sugar transport system substrate-binding protein
MVGYGARNFTSDGLICTLDSPEAIAAMQLYYRMIHVEHALPTPAESAALSSQGGWGNSGMQWFSSGKAAMISIGRWYIVQLPNYPDLQGHLGAVTLPHVGLLPSRGACDTRAAGINAKSPHWREALSFLQYLASPEYSKLIVHDGDSLPPNPMIARTGADIVNEAASDPAFQTPFIQAIKNGHTLPGSPFLGGNLLGRLYDEQVQRVENAITTPENAMQTLTAQANHQIRLNLEHRTDLQQSYKLATGHPYARDWWRKHTTR